MEELDLIVERVQALLPSNANSATIEVLAEMAIEEATEYCRLAEYTAKLNPAVVKMVIQNYNKRGSEGISSQGYSGVSESFVDGYTQDVYNILNANINRKIKII